MRASPSFAVTCALVVACGGLHGRRMAPDAGQGGAAGGGGVFAQGGVGGTAFTFCFGVGGATGGARTTTGGASGAVAATGGAGGVPVEPRACPDIWRGAVMALDGSGAICEGRCQALSPSSAACTTLGCELILAAGPVAPIGLAVDASHVYWSESYSVMKLSAKGGSPVALAPLVTVAGPLAVDGTAVYFVDPTAGTLSSVPIAGGAVTVLATGAAPTGLAVADGFVYFTDRNAGTVNKVPAGGGPVVVLVDQQAGASALAVDDRNVFWVAETQATGRVWRASRDGGVPTALTPASQYYPQAIAVDATHLYWVAAARGSAATEAFVMKVALAGGEPTTLVPAGRAGAMAIVVHGDDVYWTNRDSGTVMKVPLDGGAPTTLALTSYCHPGALAVRNGSVYWLAWPEPSL